MAKEAIEAIRKAEEEANNILQEAIQTSRDSKRETQLLAEEKFKLIIDEANNEAKELREKALLEGENISIPIINKGDEESKKILNMSDAKLESAANIIIERIVNVNGNS